MLLKKAVTTRIKHGEKLICILIDIKEVEMRTRFLIRTLRSNLVDDTRSYSNRAQVTSSNNASHQRKEGNGTPASLLQTAPASIPKAAPSANTNAIQAPNPKAAPATPSVNKATPPTNFVNSLVSKGRPTSSSNLGNVITAKAPTNTAKRPVLQSKIIPQDSVFNPLKKDTTEFIGNWNLDVDLPGLNSGIKDLGDEKKDGKAVDKTKPLNHNLNDNSSDMDLIFPEGDINKPRLNADGKQVDPHAQNAIFIERTEYKTQSKPNALTSQRTVESVQHIRPSQPRAINSAQRMPTSQQAQRPSISPQRAQTAQRTNTAAAQTRLPQSQFAPPTQRPSILSPQQATQRTNAANAANGSSVQQPNTFATAQTRVTNGANPATKTNMPQ